MPTEKQSKPSVKYTDHGTESEHCSICTHYLPRGKCEKVKGEISWRGWCELWSKK